ncbi:hypothetical protein EPUL_004751 [Erysiphe pulchra]|uniref:REJ domain-containing protein n=1 Tax=Erysiphe pulchra TaxID=225359 RepID=A0A2S4PWS4_9PEZI|nr:hypothetical protein EPUL_004751 [Erysiphe pulchra]
MRASLLSLFGLSLLAAAAPDLQKRTDTPANTTSSYMSSAIITPTSVYSTGMETSSPTSSGMFNNGTSTTGSASSATTLSHHSSATSSSATSKTSAGAAPTGVWANSQVKGTVAGVVGVLGLALAL